LEIPEFTKKNGLKKPIQIYFPNRYWKKIPENPPKYHVPNKTYADLSAILPSQFPFPHEFCLFSRE